MLGDRGISAYKYHTWFTGRGQYCGLGAEKNKGRECAQRQGTSNTCNRYSFEHILVTILEGEELL